MQALISCRRNKYWQLYAKLQLYQKGLDLRLMLPERADNWITHLGIRVPICGI